MTKDTSKRLKVMGVGIILVFIVLIAQAFNLQIRQYDNFIQLANNNRIRLIPILAPRGTIYDRNKQAIVATRAANTVSIVPMDLKNEKYVLAKLSYILDMPLEEINKKIAEQTFRPFDPIRLKKDIQLETLAKIEEQKNDLPGVILETVPIREYIYGDLGCHLFGYVGEISQDELKALEDEGYKAGDIIGKTGLEKVYDKYLQGVNGGQQVQVNASGKMISIMGEKKIVPGNNLILNIDAKVQKTAENALKEAIGKTPGAKGGAVVAMDPRNGQIIALVSQPGFMPNKFATGISLKDWSSLINDKRHPMKNRVTESAYPPGSIYKILMAIAALEEHKVTASDTFYCGGHYKWGFHCWNRSGHGTETLITGLRDSCNAVFYSLGQRLGPAKISEYSKRFGLGEKTGIDLLGEEKGLLPSPDWKMKNYHEEWYPGETLNMSIGQGYHLTTPIQLAQMVSAAVNGGSVYKPYIVNRIVSPNGQLIKQFQPYLKETITIAPDNLAMVKEGMRQVVEKGTASAAFNGFPITAGGKTGTAQAGPGKGDHAWFASAAPLDNPELVVVVFVEEGLHGSSTAAPVARRVYEAYFGLQK